MTSPEKEMCNRRSYTHIYRTTNKNKITKLFSVVELPAKFTPGPQIYFAIGVHVTPDPDSWCSPVQPYFLLTVVWCDVLN